jgi:hypothetical protein
MIDHSFCGGKLYFFNSMLEMAEDIEKQKQIILIQLFFLTTLPFKLSNKSN